MRKGRGHSNKTPLLQQLGDATTLLQAALSETLWPTRCVICDLPGNAVCKKCLLNLPYLDALLACPTCGAPWGRGICCECNQQTLRWKGLQRFPLDGCASAVVLAPETKRIVTAYKDRGEQQLASIIAQCMANVLPPSWCIRSTLVPIPARKEAVRQRGFDHACLVAHELSHLTGTPVLHALAAKPRRDQRNLDARQRLANMAGSFAIASEPGAGAARLKAQLRLHPRIILVDDVFTTGATLFTAAKVLRSFGAEKTYALTFIRA